MVWFNYRRVPAISLAKQLIDEGRIGRPFHFRANFLQDWTISADVPQGGDALWRLDVKAAGSGVTGDLLAHNIDTAMWLNGAITRVVAKTETFVKERMHTADRQGGTRRHRRRLHVHRGVRQRLDGHCSNPPATRAATRRSRPSSSTAPTARVAFNLEEMEYLDYFEYSRHETRTSRGWRRIHVTNGEHPYMNRYWVPGLVIGYEHTFLNALADFVAGLESGKPAQPDFRTALQTQKVCEAILQSAKTGQWTETGVEL